jgi:hypothetical protein
MCRKAGPVPERKIRLRQNCLIGLQPALLERVSQAFSVRVVDLDPENIGREKNGVLIEDAREKTGDLEKWCDLLLVTAARRPMAPL